MEKKNVGKEWNKLKTKPGVGSKISPGGLNGPVKMNLSGEFKTSPRGVTASRPQLAPAPMRRGGTMPTGGIKAIGGNMGTMKQATPAGKSGGFPMPAVGRPAQRTAGGATRMSPPPNELQPRRGSTRRG